MKKDIELRDRIIFGEPYDPDAYQYGGLRYFNDMSVDTVKSLLHGDLIDPHDAQNNAPTICEIYEFMKNHPNFTAHGYAVDIKRDDYRISIEGVNKGSALTPDEMKDFIELFRFADEFDIDNGYCWFD